MEAKIGVEQFTPLGNHTTQQPATGAGLPSANLRNRTNPAPAPADQTAGVGVAPAEAPAPDGPQENGQQFMSTQVDATYANSFETTSEWAPPMEILVADWYDESPSKDDVEAYVSIKESRLMKDKDGNFKTVTIPKGYHQAR